MKLPAYLAAQAQLLPDKAALVCGEHRVTFRQLHEESSRIAAYLSNAGINVGDRVAICLPNCCEFVTIFFGIVQCGAIAMPINMRLAANEISTIINDAEPAAAFYGESERETVAKIGLESLQRYFVGDAPNSNETPLKVLLATEIGQVDVPAECDDCMISYTSGTTGRPKGVITTQANYIVANGYLNATYWRLSADDRILVTTPLAHRTAFARVGNMAVLGATLYIMPRFDPEEAARIIEAEQITLISIVPTVGRMMLPSIEADPGRYRSLPRSRGDGRGVSSRDQAAIDESTS